MKLPTILETKPNRWLVQGQRRQRYDRGLRPAYWVTRNGTGFWCACPAKTLCKHIRAVVKANALIEGWDVVQFTTDEAKAKDQRRRLIEMEAHGRKFWVAYGCRWARQYVPDGARFAGVVRDRWARGEPLFDVYFWRNGLRGRLPVRRT